jgi:hypothetical protein
MVREHGETMNQQQLKTHVDLTLNIIFLHEKAFFIFKFSLYSRQHRTISNLREAA